MNNEERNARNHKEWLETAIRYLNKFWIAPERLHHKLELREVDGEYRYYDVNSGQRKRVLSHDEIIEEAQERRLIEWRRAYYKSVDNCLQCSICGEKFERASQHLAPCVQKEQGR